jgi:hypothetical protein
MNFTEHLAREIARAAEMTLPELEEALAAGEGRTVGELTALSLAKKAAEGGMDAVKLIRELSKGEQPKEQLPQVEIRVVGPDGDE